MIPSDIVRILHSPCYILRETITPIGSTSSHLVLLKTLVLTVNVFVYSLLSPPTYLRFQTSRIIVHLTSVFLNSTYKFYHLSFSLSTQVAEVTSSSYLNISSCPLIYLTPHPASGSCFRTPRLKQKRHCPD